MNRSAKARRSIRLHIPDRPGALAQVTRTVADREVDIVRLEVWPGDGADAFDDLTLEAASEQIIAGTIRDLRGAGFDVATLPDHWWLRDWAREVFEAIELLDRATSRLDQLDIVLDASRRLGNVSHAFIVSEPAGGESLAHRIDDVALSFESEWISWRGQPHVIGALDSAISRAREGPVAHLKPVDPINGLAVEIPGRTAASSYLGVVGVRPAFIESETTRVERFASLVGRLHPVDGELTAY